MAQHHGFKFVDLWTKRWRCISNGLQNSIIQTDQVLKLLRNSLLEGLVPKNQSPCKKRHWTRHRTGHILTSRRIHLGPMLWTAGGLCTKEAADLVCTSCVKSVSIAIKATLDPSAAGHSSGATTCYGPARRQEGLCMPGRETVCLIWIQAPAPGGSCPPRASQTSL